MYRNFCYFRQSLWISFRSAPAPYPECQPSQAALEQNSPEYLTSLANLEVGSILRVMEQPEMYADYVDASNPSNPSTDNKPTKSVHHPIVYVSGLFRGSQLNWAALTKEAYAIYLSVRKFSFYLTSADVLIRSDHLLLRKFLSQSTTNKKVDNWAVELESFNLKFEYIQGIKNTLADTLSRIIQLDLDVELPTEKPGHEFGYNFLEDLPPIEVSEVIVEGVEIKPDPNTFLKDIDLTLPLKNETIRSLQAQDGKVNSILERLQNGDVDGNLYMVEDGILRR